MKIIRFFLILIVMQSSLNAAKEWEQFLRANQAFENGDTAQALKEYQDISDKGPIVFYNIALCHERLNDPFQALIAFKQAQKQADRNLFNLVTPRIEKLENHFSKPHDTAFISYAKWLNALFSLRVVQIFFLSIWWALLIALYYLRSNTKKIILFFLLLLLIMSGSIGFCLLRVKYTSHGLVAESTSVFVGPHTSFDSIATLNQADQIQIHSLQDEWYKVQYGNKVGWIEASKVIKID